MIVVVGVDESSVAKRVLAKAIDEAAWRGAELHVVNVYQLPYTYVEIPVDYGAMAEGHHSAVWGPLEAQLSEPKVEVLRVELEGYPAEALVSYANDIGRLTIGGWHPWPWRMGCADPGEHESSCRSSRRMRCADRQVTISTCSRSAK